MKVTLLSVTPDALEVLLFTKNTRLTMSGRGLEEIREWPVEKKMAELKYMRNTIQSSWEFVDFVFAIEGVTRAFTHQLVRHRVGTSFAQQAQRVVNMEGFAYLATGEDLAEGEDAVERRSNANFRTVPRAAQIYHDVMQFVDNGYSLLLNHGVKSQDARGILPTNILTNIVFKANLRTLHDMALKRLCVKAQGEFQDMFKALVDCVVSELPWAGDFLKVQCAWNGTCLFPSLPVEECHVKAHVYNPETCQSYGHPAPLLPLADLYQLHRSTRTEIQPTVVAAPEETLRCSKCSATFPTGHAQWGHECPLPECDGIITMAP